MKFLKSTLITFIANIFVFSISILTTVITSRALGTDGKGIISVSNNLISISLILLGLGIANSNVFFIGKNKKNTQDIIGANILVSVASILVLLLIYLLNLKFNFYFIFKGLSLNIIIVVFLTIPLMNLKTSLINVLLGLQDMVRYNKINVVDNITTLILLCLSLLIFRTAFWVVIGNFIAVAIILFVLLYFFFVKNKYKFSYSVTLLKDMLKYGVKAQIGNAVQFLNYRLDIFIINYLLPISQVGIYSIAVALCETMWKVSGTVSTIVLPMTSNSKDIKEMSKFINKITRITLTLILMCSIFIIIISKPLIIGLFGKDFSGGVNALVLLIPGISIFSVCNILASYMAGVGMIEKNVIASSVSCVATLILDLCLIPKMGINGASVATSISYIIATIITLVFYIKLTKSHLADILIIKREDLLEIKTRLIPMFNKLRR